MQSPIDFETRLRQYARLIVKVGLNLQPGQRLRVGASILAAPLVRQVAIAAYQAGADYVDVIWIDSQLDLIRLEHATADSLDIFPQWRLESRMEYARRHDAILGIRATQPDLFLGQDASLVSRILQSQARTLQPFQNEQMAGHVNWLGVVAATPEWAVKLFPDLSAEVAVDRLWQIIFQVVRLNEPDPERAWREHLAGLAGRCRYLSEKGYAELRFRGPGTNLAVGLARQHLWAGGSVVGIHGIEFTPNLPTEEVFTLPHKDRVEGIVTSTKPLNLRGVLVEDFVLTFEAGRVISVTAAKGEEMLRRMIDADDGAGRLGEVALVPHSSPISQVDRLFYDTLYDENAASHIALGNGYKLSIRDGSGMSDADFATAGGNQSLIHIDFMIGSGQMDVDGVMGSGQVEPLMRSGEWAFSV